MTKIMILEDSIDSLKALKAIVESVSKDIAVIPVKSLEEARAALQDEANLFQAFLLDINPSAPNQSASSALFILLQTHAGLNTSPFFRVRCCWVSVCFIIRGSTTS